MVKGQIFRLKNFGLPEITSINNLAEYIGLSPELVSFAVFRSRYLYKKYSIEKKDGSPRWIAQPSRELKAIQAWILRNILDKLHSSNFSKGFEKGCSILDNATPHVGAGYVLNVDLKDFFPSVSAAKVFKIFSSIGYSEKVAWMLTSLCVFEGWLPQGAPTSPKLANLVCLQLDARIQGYAAKKGLIYTRYADDISLSSQTIKKIYNSRSVLKTIVISEGFQINERKTQIQGNSKKKCITGLVLSKNDVGIGRVAFRVIRAKIFNIYAGKSKDVSHVEGVLAHVLSVDQKAFRKLMIYIYMLNAKFKAGSGPSSFLKFAKHIG